MNGQEISCRNCRFFEENEQGAHECRAESPRMFMVMAQKPSVVGRSEMQPQFLSSWPAVQKTQWCGKHEPVSGQKLGFEFKSRTQ